jgi:hypothetical protein
MDPEPETEAEAEAEAEAENPVETAAELFRNESRDRLWLKVLTPLLQTRSHESDPSGRVQFAFDLMYVAACERIARILRSDLGP